MKGPLSGIRILDLTTMVSGPISTMLLDDQGAEVIKIEAPGGEYMRRVGVKHSGMSSSFLTSNRVKRSVCLDIKRPEVSEIIQKLIATSDVLVQNFRPGVRERLGLSEAAVREVSPSIVYVSVSYTHLTLPTSDLE